MVLHIIGLGLARVDDITIRGKAVLESCDVIYLEGYTSILMCSKEALEEFHGRDIILMDRDMVESGCQEMIEAAVNKQVGFLVVGDPFCATTHSDLYLRAIKHGVKVKVIHNASIMNAIAEVGLQLYNFGETVSIPYFEKDWKPQSFYDKILKNHKNSLHSLCLLDIKVKEQTVENMMRENNIFEPPRFMNVQEALEQLVEIESERKEGLITNDTKIFAVARLGAEDQLIKSGTVEEMLKCDLGGPLHSMVVAASQLHEVELEYYDLWRK